MTEMKFNSSSVDLGEAGEVVCLESYRVVALLPFSVHFPFYRCRSANTQLIFGFIKLHPMVYVMSVGLDPQAVIEVT